jgi:glycosyltransferase involved in cell wall biosynthesis
VISSPGPGPASARNAGAQAASYRLLFFVDADVCLHPGALLQARTAFAGGAEFAALIGSYDDAPAAPQIVSQYRNLLHHYTHQTANPEASTFWAGCGVIEREVFLELGGFDESYRTPAVEDIELGYRLRKLGKRIRLDRTIQAKHLKRWTFLSMLRTDIFQRAIPWMELILRDRELPNDLNVQTSQRVCIVSALLAPVLLVMPVPGWAAALPAASVVWWNRRFYAFLARRKGPVLALAGVGFHYLYFFYSGLSIPAALALHLGRNLFRHHRL